MHYLTIDNRSFPIKPDTPVRTLDYVVKSIQEMKIFEVSLHDNKLFINGEGEVDNFRKFMGILSLMNSFLDKCSAVVIHKRWETYVCCKKYK